ncbi:MAG: hypothetical protein ABI467_33100 [Kofleriaceae bacterium]
MVRFRNIWLVAVVALGLGGAACKKNDAAKKTDDKAAPGDKATPTGDKPAGGGAAMSDSSASDLSLLPVDSEMVIGLNIAQLQQSALWKQFSPKLMDKISGDLADFKNDCGFDPLESIKSIAMGMKNMGGGGSPDGAVVIHGPDKAKVLACIEKEKDKAKAKGTEMTVDGDVVLMKDKNGEASAFTFVNDSTMLGVIGSKGTAEGVKEAAKGGSALKTSQTFLDMYSKINTQDSLWMLINGNSPALAKAGSMGIKPKAVFGSINLTDGLTVDFRVRMGTPEEAKSLVGMMQGQIGNPQVKQMFDTLDITGDGADAKVTVKMSAQKLQALVGMVGGMMGGMLGGMGGAPAGAP